MKTFADYYKDLLIWEEVKSQELISTWQPNLIAEIKADFTQSVSKALSKNLFCEFTPDSQNQSIGNQIEVYIIERLNQYLQVFTIENCSGSGYPDKFLAKGDWKQIALEMKATSNWNDADSNRRVLTSSSKKLREKFVSPIYHLLCTVQYQNQNNSAIINSVRLDFIEPNSQVGVRLEASVSHKSLVLGTHEKIIFEVE